MLGEKSPRRESIINGGEVSEQHKIKAGILEG